MSGIIWLSLVVVGLLAVGIYQVLDRLGLFEGAPPDISPGRLNGLLHQFLETEVEDLVANRDGRLSPSQQQKMQTMYQKSGSGLGCTLVMIFGSLLFFLGMIIFGEGGEIWALIQREPLIGLIYAAVIAIFVAAGLGSYIYQRLTMGALGDQPVQAIEGRVRLRKRYAKGTYYTVSVGRRTFYVTLQQYKGFVSGATYRLYYIPFYSTYMLISAESV